MAIMTSGPALALASICRGANGASAGMAGAALVAGGALTACGTTLVDAPLSAMILSFVAYGFVGWLWESTVCAMLNHGHFANSGFLLGPCCPIYGVGGLVCWLALRGIDNVYLQFIAAAIACSIVEYAVGVLLELTTHARFWDYSDMPFNINGRVCLYGALMFGLGAVGICRAAEPALLACLGALPAWTVHGLAVVVVVLLAVDTALSLASWRRLSDTLERVRVELADRINDSLQDASDSMLEHIPDAALDSASTAHVRGRAINGWLAEISDAVMDAVREHVDMPRFIVDGTRGLRMVAGRVRSVAARGVAAGTAAVSHTVHATCPVPKISLSRRDLRFFNAFPHLRLNRYEGVIRATDLRRRAHKLFRWH